MKKILLNAGDIAVASEPVMFETVLGASVSICLWDEKLKIAGMNHYMMPGVMGDMKDHERSGPESINRLVDSILELGSNLRNLKAKVFGGGNAGGGGVNGKENVLVAKKILGYYKIPVIKEHTGNDCGIKVVFMSATGATSVEKFEK